MTGSAVTSVALLRYWNAAAGDHFYTTDPNELGNGNYGWALEGVQCYAFPQQVPGTVPLYRYWNPNGADHFYTTDRGELGAGNYGWGYEGIQCYVYPQPSPNAVPLYRYWNPGAFDHFYTTNWNELGSGNYGWGYEGVQCFVPTQAGPPSAGGTLSALGRTNGNGPPPAPPASFNVPSTAMGIGRLGRDAFGGTGSSPMGPGRPATFATGPSDGIPESFRGAGATVQSPPESFRPKKKKAGGGVSITLAFNDPDEQA